MKSQTPLKILLVLSILSAASNFLSHLMMALFLPALNTFYNSHPGLLPAEFYALWEQMSTVPRPYYAGMALLSALSLMGCIMMWKLHRPGYHCYAIAQLLMLVLPLLFLGKGYLGVGDVMFTALFLLIYYLMLKRLDVFSPKESLLPEDETESEEND